MNLLTTVGNPKTDKSASLGYLTAVMHLAPASLSGYQVCPMAEMAQCIAGCLNTAGRGGIPQTSGAFIQSGGYSVPDNAIQRARISRTRLYFENRQVFLGQLIKEISAHIKRASKLGMTPVIRLNGTSDISFENIRHDGLTLFEVFPDVQFYDYTKVTSRLAVKRALPSNYFLAVSWSGASEVYRLKAEHTHAKYHVPLVVVVRDELQKIAYLENNPLAIDGDIHDLIFMHGQRAIIVLRAKGKAKKDTSGFVMDYLSASVSRVAA